MENYDYEYVYDDKKEKKCKETVCIDAPRIYDSCSDKECIENLRVYFSQQAQQIVDKASGVRIKDVKVLFAYPSLEPVAFHKGFYSIDITFYFEVKFDVFSAPVTKFAEVSGLGVYSKNVVLYGSEGSVKVFSSEYSLDEFDTHGLPTHNLPKATVQVAEPIGLDAKLRNHCHSDRQCCKIPSCICNRYAELCFGECQKAVYVTIGIFYIVQIQRNVQLLIPSYDFCIPQKECTTSDDPCELFRKIEFPTEEFFPPKYNKDMLNPCKEKKTKQCGCG